MTEQELKEMRIKVQPPPTLYFCAPNCMHDHHHNYEYDFSKTYLNPQKERPGQEIRVHQKANSFLSKFLNTTFIEYYGGTDALTEVACPTGSLQSPINLNTKTPILPDFEDR